MKPESLTNKMKPYNTRASELQRQICVDRIDAYRIEPLECAVDTLISGIYTDQKSTVIFDSEILRLTLFSRLHSY